MFAGTEVQNAEHHEAELSPQELARLAEKFGPLLPKESKNYATGEDYESLFRDIENEIKKLEDQGIGTTPETINKELLKKLFLDLKREAHTWQDNHKEATEGELNNYLETLYPRALAIIKKSFLATKGIELYDMQLASGLELTYGVSANIPTGEGKTYIAGVAAIINSLRSQSGGKTQILTPNNYLAERDCDDLRPVYDTLGLKTGFADREGRKFLESPELFEADILYLNYWSLVFLNLNALVDPAGVLKAVGSRSRLEELFFLPKGLRIVDEVDAWLDTNLPAIMREATNQSPESQENRQKFIEEAKLYLDLVADLKKPADIKKALEDTVRELREREEEALEILEKIESLKPEAEADEGFREAVQGLDPEAEEIGVEFEKWVEARDPELIAKLKSLLSEVKILNIRLQEIISTEPDLETTPSSGGTFVLTEEGISKVITRYQEAHGLANPDELSKEIEEVALQKPKLRQKIRNLLKAGRKSKPKSGYDELDENQPDWHLIEVAMNAVHGLQKGFHYIVEEKSGKKEIVIIDPETQRALPGHKFRSELQLFLELYNEIEASSLDNALATLPMLGFYALSVAKGENRLSGMSGSANNNTASTLHELFGSNRDRYLRMPHHSLFDYPRRHITEVTEYELGTETTEQEPGFESSGESAQLVIETRHENGREGKHEVFRGAKIFEPKVYSTEEKRLRGVIEKAVTESRSGRPVLVVTSGNKTAETVIQMLSEQDPKIQSQLLVGSLDLEEKEDEIVRLAGTLSDETGYGVVTVATQVAGRGTDIKLGRNPEEKEKIIKHGGLSVLICISADSRSALSQLSRVMAQIAGRTARNGKPGSLQIHMVAQNDLISELNDGRGRTLREMLDNGGPDGVSQDRRDTEEAITKIIKIFMDRADRAEISRIHDVKENVKVENQYIFVYLMKLLLHQLELSSLLIKELPTGSRRSAGDDLNEAGEGRESDELGKSAGADAFAGLGESAGSEKTSQAGRPSLLDGVNISDALKQLELAVSIRVVSSVINDLIDTHISKEEQDSYKASWQKYQDSLSRDEQIRQTLSVLSDIVVGISEWYLEDYRRELWSKMRSSRGGLKEAVPAVFNSAMTLIVKSAFERIGVRATEAVKGS